MNDQMTSKERVLGAICWQEIDRIPIFSGGGGARINLRANNSDEVGEALAERALASWKEFGGDSIGVAGGSATIAKAFGAKLKYPDFGPPMYDQPVIFNHNDADRLKVPDPYKDKSLLAILRGLKILKKKVGNQILINSGLGGLFNPAGMLLGTDNLMKFLIKDIELVHKVCRKITEAQIAYGKALIEAGAELIQIPDANSSPYCVNPRTFEEVALPYLAERIKSFKQLGAYTSLNTYGYGDVEFVGKTGADILNFNEVDLSVVQKIYVGRHAVSGPVETAGVVFVLTQQELAKRVKDIISNLAYQTGAILHLSAEGAGNKIGAKERLKALIKIACKYGDYRKNKGKIVFRHVQRADI